MSVLIPQDEDREQLGRGESLVPQFKAETEA